VNLDFDSLNDDLNDDEDVLEEVLVAAVKIGAPSSP